MSALKSLGLEVEYLRWWDDKQTGGIIHFFGRPSGDYIRFAQAKEMGVVISDLLGGMGARSTMLLAFQARAVQGIRRLPKALWARMGWDAYQLADRIIALTPWEASLMERILGASPERLKVVPNGVARENSGIEGAAAGRVSRLHWDDYQGKESA